MISLMLHDVSRNRIRIFGKGISCNRPCSKQVFEAGLGAANCVVKSFLMLRMLTSLKTDIEEKCYLVYIKHSCIRTSIDSN